MNDADESRSHTLRRIASVLGVPMAALYGPSEAEASVAQGPAPCAAEELALIVAYRRIRDPHARQCVLDAARLALQIETASE